MMRKIAASLFTNQNRRITMKNYICIFAAAIVLATAVCNVKAYTQDDLHMSWVGESNGDWETGANWESFECDPGFPPPPACTPYRMAPDNNGTNVTDTFYVTINGGTGGVEVGLGENHTITSLHCQGQVELQSYNWYNMNLTVLNGFTNSGQTSIDSLDITGNVTNNTGGYLDLGSHLNIHGNLYNAAGAKIEAYPDDVDIEGGTVHNDGLIWANGGGNLGEADGFINDGQIQFFFAGSCNGETFVNNGTGSITGSGAITGGTLTNIGTIYAVGGPFLCYFENITNTGTIGNLAGGAMSVVTSSSDMTNHGVIEINAGGSTAFDSNLINASNGIIRMLGGTLAATTITQSAGAAFEGFGAITGNVIISPSGLIKLTGPTNIIGNVTIQSGATLEISDGQTLVTGATVNNGTIHIKGGRFVPQGGLTGGGTITWEAGDIYNSMTDFDLDGKVDFRDFAAFADTWMWQAASN